MKKKVVLIALAGILSTTTTQAGNLRLALGAKAGTLGAGLEAFAPISQRFNARISLNQFDYSYNQVIDDIDYTGNLNLSSVTLNGDWHPFNGVFRLTAGAVINNNEITGTATPSQNVQFTIGDNDYSSKNIRANAQITFNKLSPYLGFGFDKVSKFRRGGLGISAEFGVVFQGTPQSNLEVVDLNKGLPDEIKGPLLDQLNADIQKEVDAMSSDLEAFNIWPVASLGLTYQF